MAPAGTKTFLPGKGCSAHTRALQDMTHLPFCPPFPTLSPLSSRFPLSSLVPHSPDTLPSGLPRHQQRDAPVAANKTVILRELRDPSAQRIPSMPEGAEPPWHRTPRRHPKAVLRRCFQGVLVYVSFGFVCFLKKPQLLKTLKPT